MQKFFHSINASAFCQTTWQNVASTVNNRNPQAKGKFQVLLEQDLQKTGKCLLLQLVMVLTKSAPAFMVIL